MLAGAGDVVVAVADSKGGRRAARWAGAHLAPFARRVVLLHSVPTLTALPSPSGESVPVDRVARDVVEMYVADLKAKTQQALAPYKKLCGSKNVEILVLEGRSPESTIAGYVGESGVKCLVVGSSSSWIRRMLKGPNVATNVLKSAPISCTVFVVSRRNLTVRFTKQPVSGLLGQDPMIYAQIGTVNLKVFAQSQKGHILHEQSSIVSLRGSDKSEQLDSEDASTYSQNSSRSSFSQAHSDKQLHDENFKSKRRGYNVLTSLKEISVATLKSKKEGTVSIEALRLRTDLQNTLRMYNQVCEDLVRAKKKLSIENFEEANRAKDTPSKAKPLKGTSTDKLFRHLEAIREVHEARHLPSKDEAVAFASKTEALLSDSNRCRHYSREEIETATGRFSDANKIGVGSYGDVYKGKLGHTPVAIKVFRQDHRDKTEEFLREVEILSQLHHPNVVLLLGICPEIGCLVYEYMENKSLEDLLFRGDDTKATLPWHTRVRIIYEVARGLAFLHGMKPDPIVHRDLKPGNILLDKHYVAKIGDVGLAKLLHNIVPDGLTEYNETMIAGTLYYMDPEYQRTGTLRPKSDLYALGVIALQVLTGRHPDGLIVCVENALSDGGLADVLDVSIPDWPLAEAEKLAKLALRCTTLRCRDRPELELEVLPELVELNDMATEHLKSERRNGPIPSHFICPLTQEVMEEPHIAADGYTYEYSAIKAWLEKSSISPVTKIELPRVSLVPNHSLCDAIQQWRAEAEL